MMQYITYNIIHQRLANTKMTVHKWLIWQLTVEGFECFEGFNGFYGFYGFEGFESFQGLVCFEGDIIWQYNCVI